MRTIVFFFIILLPIFGHAQDKVDLDAPAAKKITIRSEIERGGAALSECNSRSTDSSFFKADDCGFHILDQNKQKNTDTDAFILGLSFSVWTDLAIRISVLEKEPNREDLDYSQGLRGSIIWFKNYREKASKIGVDEKKICEVLGAKYEVTKPMVDDWNKRTKIPTDLK